VTSLPPNSSMRSSGLDLSLAWSPPTSGRCGCGRGPCGRGWGVSKYSAACSPPDGCRSSSEGDSQPPRSPAGSRLRAGTEDWSGRWAGGDDTATFGSIRG
jgi:hypothetical protein